MRRQRAIFIAIVQSILFAAHALVYQACAAFFISTDSPETLKLAIIFAVLSVTFIAASLLAFSYSNFVVRIFYRFAAAWLGILNYLFLASIGCWIVYFCARIAVANWRPREIAIVFFGLAAAAGIGGIINSLSLRVRRIKVKLPNLPDSWRGRIAALVSDTHLGPVRGHKFSRHIVSILNREQPHVVFFAGDIYDGTAGDARIFVNSFADIAAPLGSYFVTGNHEEFGNPARYLEALKSVGVRVLENEKVIVDGLQIVGVSYRDLSSAEHFRSVMKSMGLKKDCASILLAHAPNRLWEAEQAGVSLQLSGHTHAGQFFPWTLIVSRIYGKFAYGLQKLGNMSVYTSCGAGTWGPPVRLGTNPEMVVIQFE